MIFRDDKSTLHSLNRSESGDSLIKEAPNTSRTSSTVGSLTRARGTGKWRAYILMFGTLSFALAICVAHHVFLSVINGRDVEDFTISQTWTRDIGNAFSWLAQFLLQISVGVALTQSVRTLALPLAILS